MNRLAAVAALAVVLLAAPDLAAAQVPTLGTFVFSTVDEVAFNSGTFSVTGVLQGESAATTRAAYATSSAAIIFEPCSRYALLAQAKPGQYLLEFTVGSLGAITACRLRRAVP